MTSEASWSAKATPRSRRGRCSRTCAAVSLRVGATFDDVVRLNYYLTDIHDLPAVRVIRDEFISADHPPASTAVQVVALALPGLHRYEIDATALTAD